MLFLFWFLLLLVGLALFFLMPSLLAWPVYARYRGVRMVSCPQTHGPAAVRIDALHAAHTGLWGTEKLRLAACSLWPERLGCDQACLSQAVALPIQRPQEKPAAQIATGIYYLAVLAGAAAYWLVCAFWYSHFLFRGTWMRLMGYSDPQVRNMIELSQPQLATALWSLLFTLVVARVIARTDRHGLRKGAETGMLAWFPVWVAIVVTVVYRGLPIDLVWIHGDATLIASILSGMILGTWTKGRILRALDHE
jgi:hypothetical protein